MDEGFDPDVVTAYERDTWNRCANDYIDTFAGITGETVPLLIDSAGIGAGSQVLEIGSGPGHVADMLVQAGASVTGVDFSANMVDVAQSSFPSRRSRLMLSSPTSLCITLHGLKRSFGKLTESSNRVVGLYLQCGVRRRNKAALARSSVPS